MDDRRKRLDKDTLDPRLIQLERRFSALLPRVDALEARTSSGTIPTSTSIKGLTRYRIWAPSDPNVVAPGTNWAQIDTIAEDTRSWDTTIDGYFECKKTGFWRMFGTLVVTAGSIRDALYIRIDNNGALTTPTSVTSSAVIASGLMVGPFDIIVRVSSGSIVKLNTYRAGNAGVCSSTQVAGVELSTIEMQYLGDT
jgi:hypothetical protein